MPQLRILLKNFLNCKIAKMVSENDLLLFFLTIYTLISLIIRISLPFSLFSLLIYVLIAFIWISLVFLVYIKTNSKDRMSRIIPLIRYTLPVILLLFLIGFFYNLEVICFTILICIVIFHILLLYVEFDPWSNFPKKIKQLLVLLFFLLLIVSAWFYIFHLMLI